MTHLYISVTSDLLSVTPDLCLVLQVVVAESFDDIVNDPDKDVLIQFYSPSCPHCKKLEPIYRELADMVCHHQHLF